MCSASWQDQTASAAKNRSTIVGIQQWREAVLERYRNDPDVEIVEWQEKEKR